MLAVILGAFGAHGLKSHFSEQQMAWYETAVDYQTIHAIALIITGIIRAVIQPTKLVDLAAYSFLAGVILFSGSLYLLAIFQISALGAITAAGGFGFILGWALLTFAAIKSAKDRKYN